MTHKEKLNINIVDSPSTFSAMRAANLIEDDELYLIEGEPDGSGGGNGDMEASVYDPRKIEADVFNVDNHTDGQTNKVFTANEKEKLSGIEGGANKYVHPATHPPSIILQDASNRFVTDSEKTAWAGKANTATYTATLLGSGWTNAGDYRWQWVTVPGILATDNPIVDVVLSGDAATALSQSEEWPKVHRMVPQENGGITAICYGDSPTVDLPIQLKVVR